MRLALKHQIILAPTTVLLLMTLLLGFLQYTYWDLSVKRQEAKNLGTVYIALAEADLGARQMRDLARRLTLGPMVDSRVLHAMVELHRRLASATEKITGMMQAPEESLTILKQSVADLDPERGVDPERFLTALDLLLPQLGSLAERLEQQRMQLAEVHRQDIDELVARTALVSLIVLGAAILLGIFLSLTFARRILRRIQVLSDSAGRIARGELIPPPAPKKVGDELDDLALSINRMTERLIRVVGAEKLLEGAEEERRRIAMDIHDQTLSDLSSVLRGIQGMKDFEDCRQPADSLEEDLQRAISNLREVMDNLHPQTLEILGLGAALESHMERHLAKSGYPEYHLYSSPEIETAGLPRLARLTLYRIAVEAVHNVIKHARAERYEVNFSRRDGEIVLSVEDNGIGFDPQKASSQGGRGLNNIRERASAIGAKVGWGPSRFTTGTRFELVLPLGETGE